jgi:predicted N-acyltransferase
VSDILVSDASVSVRVLQSIDEVTAVQWNALSTDDDSPFVEHAFLQALEVSGCACAAHGWTPAHITVWRGETLVTAAPAYIKDHSEGEFVFDWAWADAAHRAGIAYYPKLLLAVPFTPATGSRLLRLPSVTVQQAAHWIASAAKALAQQLKLSSVHALFVPEFECAALETEGFARREGVQFHWHNEGYKTFDDFLARFQSKRRHSLKREKAQPLVDGTKIETLTGAQLSLSMAPLMHKLYLTTVDKFVWGRRYLNERFYEELIKHWSHRMEWVQATANDETVIAGAFNARRGTALYGRYWGALKEQPFLHFNVCYYHGIERSIAQGLQRFEPGAGGEHKLARGFDPTLTRSAHFIMDSRLDRAVRGFLQGEVRAIRSAVASERAQSPLRRKGA